MFVEYIRYSTIIIYIEKSHVSIQEIKKDLAEVADNPSALLFFVKELSESVPAEEIVEALIGALEDATGLNFLS